MFIVQHQQRLDLQFAGVQLRQDLALFDVLLQALLLVVAIVIGVKTLWDGHPVWGATSDYFAAFFWGLGLNEFAFSSLSALGTKFEK